MLNDKQDFYTEFINNKMKNPRHLVVDLLVEATGVEPVSESRPV